ncbi:MAG: sigma-54-dependent Fis family transcriptional regulator, partial [Planctomycetes bacterium]|nr:sigma-54-dependent Fis family transcriptional regulator [Planctomycetota bacterium]
SVVGRAIETLSAPDPAEPRRELVGNDRGMREVYALVKKVAPTDSTVLISGESGTGKELVARAIHERSPRARERFVSINCSAFTETLLESELFGHVRGAFTGALDDRKGLFAAAHRGTLFLDEIADMSPATQVKILRVLEERRVLPVGGTEEVRVDARIIAATNRSMEEEIRKGRFREDLYYRLNVIPISLPPLRDRKVDIPLLAGHFLAKYARQMGKDVRSLASSAQQTLLEHDWPGNVRELENIIQRHVALCDGPEIGAIHLGRSSACPPRKPEGFEIPESGLDLDRTLEDIERSYLVRALEATDGNMTLAARLLGMSYRSIRYKVKKLGVRASG